MDPIQAVIADLERRRDRLTHAIEALRQLDDSPTSSGVASSHERVKPESRPTPVRPVAPKWDKETDADSLSDRLLALMKEGASSPKDLTALSKADKVHVRVALKALVKRGLVRVEGTTTTRRYHLVQAKGKKSDRAAAAKEDP